MDADFTFRVLLPRPPRHPHCCCCCSCYCCCVRFNLFISARQLPAREVLSPKERLSSVSVPVLPFDTVFRVRRAESPPFSTPVISLAAAGARASSCSRQFTLRWLPRSGVIGRGTSCVWGVPCNPPPVCSLQDFSSQTCVAFVTSEDVNARVCVQKITRNRCD